MMTDKQAEMANSRGGMQHPDIKGERFDKPSDSNQSGSHANGTTSMTHKIEHTAANHFAQHKGDGSCMNCR